MRGWWVKDLGGESDSAGVIAIAGCVSQCGLAMGVSRMGFLGLASIGS